MLRMTLPEVSVQQIADWVLRLLAPLIVGVLSALLAYRWRRSDEKRDSHLAKLRAEVFGPMLTYLDKYVRPILRHETGNIDICIRQIRNPTGLTERPFFEQVICVRIVTEPLQVHTFGMGVVPELPPPPDGPLVDDARRRHFRDLFRKWDAVIARFLEYNGTCLRHVETLRTQIVEENSLLPEFTLQFDGLGPEWVNAAALAVIVFLRQIGLPLRELTFEPKSDPRVWSYNTLTVAKGTVAKVVALEAQVKKLVDQRDQVQDLLATAESLAADAAALRATVDEQRLKPGLSGSCPYM